MEKLKLSIVTPSYNCGEYIEETILSVISQDYDDFEYFIIDGGSKDNTVGILKKYSKKYPNRFQWLSEPDQGQTSAINKGLKMSSGDWFAWINADDFYEPNIFSEVTKFMRLIPNTGVIYGNCYLVKENNKIKLDIPPKKVDFNMQKNGNLIYGPASFFNMKAIEKTGEFDETLQYWMDYEMYIRISKIMPLEYVDLNIANFRFRPYQKSRSQKDKDILEKERDRIIAKYYRKSFLGPLVKKLIIRNK